MRARLRDWLEKIHARYGKIAPPYAITLIMLNAFIGAIRVIESPNRTQSDAYRLAKQVMPLHAWGIVFLAVATVVLAGAGCREVLRIAAIVGMAAWIFWALLSVTTAYIDGKSSYAGGVLYGAAAARHWQVARRCSST